MCLGPNDLSDLSFQSNYKSFLKIVYCIRDNVKLDGCDAATMRYTHTQSRERLILKWDKLNASHVWSIFSNESDYVDMFREVGI